MDRKALQQVIKTALNIIGAHLQSISDIGNPAIVPLDYGAVSFTRLWGPSIHPQHSTSIKGHLWISFYNPGIVKCTLFVLIRKNIKVKSEES